MDRFEYVLMKVALLVLPLKLLLLGIQLAAFYGGLAYYAELHWMLSAIIPLIFLYFCRIQPLNCALSVVAAYYGWEVSWGNAVSVIFGLFALFFIVKAFEDATREVAT